MSQQGAVSALVAVGKAQAMLEESLHLVHLAMAVTPAGVDVVGELAEVGNGLATVLQKHNAMIQEARSNAAARDQAQKGDAQ